MTTNNNALTTVSEIKHMIANVDKVSTIPEARKIIALAQGYMVTARKLYNASEVESITEAKGDKETVLEIGKDSGALKLYMEARLGELIKIEQDEKRLGTTSNNNVTGMKTLKDYGLTKMESSRAQELAENKDIIAKVIVDSLDIPTRAAVEKEIKAQKQSENHKETPPIPEGLYNVIYADPPWKYDFSETETRKIENNYPTMDLEDIKYKYTIPTDKNCVLLIWATAPKLREALEVIEAWGFEYKTHAVWDKEIIGMGYWFRGQHELLLLATKGSPQLPAPENRISSVIRERRTEHSKKPELYNTIEKMFPESNYLELFARNTRVGWTSWGNEIDNA